MVHRRKTSSQSQAHSPSHSKLNSVEPGIKAHTTVLDRAKQRLEHAGLRMTAPRIRLLETLIADHGPFSVDDLLGLPSAKGMDRVTVYRGLQTFEEVGLVSRCEFGDGVSRYEFIHEGHHHHHIICRACKKTENIEECIPPQLLKAVQKLGYADVSHSLEFFGVCKRCQKG